MASKGKLSFKRRIRRRILRGGKRFAYFRKKSFKHRAKIGTAVTLLWAVLVVVLIIGVDCASGFWDRVLKAFGIDGSGDGITAREAGYLITAVLGVPGLTWYLIGRAVKIRTTNETVRNVENQTIQVRTASDQVRQSERLDLHKRLYNLFELTLSENREIRDAAFNDITTLYYRPHDPEHEFDFAEAIASFLSRVIRDGKTTTRLGAERTSRRFGPARQALEKLVRNLLAAKVGSRGPFRAEADWTDVRLAGADLTGANLKGANLKGANLEGAKYSADTIWPEGFTPTGDMTLVEWSDKYQNWVPVDRTP